MPQLKMHYWFNYKWAAPSDVPPKRALCGSVVTPERLTKDGTKVTCKRCMAKLEPYELKPSALKTLAEAVGLNL